MKIISKLYIQATALQFKVGIRYKQAVRLLDNAALTILGLSICGLLLTTKVQTALAQFTEHVTVFLAVAAIVGTILALAFSLSILPVQRAVESFTRSIVHLYIEDLPSQLVFTGLALICCACILFAVPGVVPLPPQFLFVVTIFLFFLGLDLLRLHNRQVCHHLIPETAILHLAQKAIGLINRVQNHVVSLSPHYYKLQNTDHSQSATISQVQSAIYASLQYHHITIIDHTDQLSEIAYKCLTKGEVYASRNAMAQMGKIAIAYVACRKTNLAFYPEHHSFFVFLQTDLDKILNPFYSRLSDINQLAVQSKAEEISVFIIDLISDVGKMLLEIKADVRHVMFQTAPSYHIKELALSALSAGYVEPAVRGLGAVVDLALKATEHHDAQALVAQHIDSWEKIATPLNGYRQAVLMNLAFEHLFRLAHLVISTEHWAASSLFESLLDKAVLHIRLGAATGVLSKAPTGDFPYSAPYNLMKPDCLGQILTTAHNLVVKKLDNNDDNAYVSFNRLNETIWHHFHTLLESVDLGTSHLFWYLLSTIRHFANVHFSLLDRDREVFSTDIETLAYNLSWYAKSVSYSLGQAKQISRFTADEATGLLSWIALVLVDIRDRRPTYVIAKIHEVAASCTKHICSVAKSYYEKGENRSLYEVADYMICIEYVKHAAENCGFKDLVKVAKEAQQAVRDAAKEHADGLSNCFDLRYGQFIEELEELDHLPDTEKPVCFLKGLLRRKRDEANTTAGVKPDA